MDKLRFGYIDSSLSHWKCYMRLRTADFPNLWAKLPHDFIHCAHEMKWCSLRSICDEQQRDRGSLKRSESQRSLHLPKWESQKQTGLLEASTICRVSRKLSWVFWVQRKALFSRVSMTFISVYASGCNHLSRTLSPLSPFQSHRVSKHSSCELKPRGKGDHRIWLLPSLQGKGTPREQRVT